MATEVQAGVNLTKEATKEGQRAWYSFDRWLKRGYHSDGPPMLVVAPIQDPKWAWVFEKSDEAVEVLLLLLAVVLVILLEFSRFPGSPRYLVIFLYGLPLDLAATVLSRVPWQVMSAGARKGKYYRRSTLRNAAATAATYDGSFLSLRKGRLLYVFLAAVLSHAPDLLAGSLVASKRSAPSLGETNGFLTVGPAGGGYQLPGGGASYRTSGLEILALDSRAYDRTVFKRVGSWLLVPLKPQEMKSGSNVMAAKVQNWPTVRIQESFGIQLAKGNRSACSTSNPDEKFQFSMNYKIEGSIVFLRVDYDPKGEQPENIAFSSIFSLDYGRANVEFDTTPFGARVLEVGGFNPNRKEAVATDSDMASAVTDMCIPFGNILHYGVDRHEGKIQAGRVAVSTVVRTATDDSIVGFGNAEKVEVRLIRGNLAFRPPIWFTYVFVSSMILAAGVSIYFNWFSRPCGSSVGHLFSIFGRDALKTGFSAPVDVRVRQPYRDGTNGELVTFGGALTSAPGDGNDAQEAETEYERNDEIQLEVEQAGNETETLLLSSRAVKRWEGGEVVQEEIRTIHLEFNTRGNVTEGDLDRDDLQGRIVA